MSSLYPETVANEVLDDLQISSPEDLQLLPQIAFARGAVIREDNLEGTEARLTYLRDKSIITISSNIANPERKRFSICHELGHLELHSNFYSCKTEDIKDKLLTEIDDDESQANQFASAFLLPARFVEEEFVGNVPTFDLIRAVASEFNTSLTATALRMTDFSKEPIAVVFSFAGKIKWFRETDDFKKMELFVKVGSSVTQISSAGRLFNGKDIRAGWREVPLDSWLKEGNFIKDAKIKESSLHMPNYNAVLSLLWIDDIIEPDELIW